MVKIFVSTVNYNTDKETLDCLNSLENVSVSDFSLNVVIVDNASQKELVIDEKKYKNFGLKLIKNSKNLGFSGGQNLGINFALKNNADYIVVLNNDIKLDKNLFLELIKTFEEKKDCGLVSPKIYFAKGHEFHKKRYEEKDLGKVIWYAGGIMDWKNVIASHRGVDEVDKGQYNELIKTDFVTGCCVMIKKEVFKDAGFFDERYFLYYEDNDLSQRAKKRGFGIYYQPKAVLWHLNAGSTGGSGSLLHDYYITRNRLLFGFKFASQRARLALFKESLKLIFSKAKWKRVAVFDFYLGRFGKGSYSA